MTTKSQTAQIKATLRKNGWTFCSGGAGSTEYSHDDSTKVVQILDGTEGDWSIMTDDFRDIASGTGAAKFEKAFNKHAKVA